MFVEIVQFDFFNFFFLSFNFRLLSDLDLVQFLAAAEEREQCCLALGLRDESRKWKGDRAAEIMSKDLADPLADNIIRYITSPKPTYNISEPF